MEVITLVLFFRRSFENGSLRPSLNFVNVHNSTCASVCMIHQSRFLLEEYNLGHFLTSMNSISGIKKESKAEEGANIILNPVHMQIGQPNCP